MYCNEISVNHSHILPYWTHHFVRFFSIKIHDQFEEVVRKSVLSAEFSNELFKGESRSEHELFLQRPFYTTKVSDSQSTFSKNESIRLNSLPRPRIGV